MKLPIGLAAGLMCAATAWAQDSAVSDYLNACASCHGVGGQGDGPMAALLSIAIPDLTQLAARNDGVFPHDTVVQAISGEYGLRGHGDPMPIWGDRFRDEAGGDAFGAKGSAAARIEALADYLAVLQE